MLHESPIQLKDKLTIIYAKSNTTQISQKLFTQHVFSTALSAGVRVRTYRYRETKVLM